MQYSLLIVGLFVAAINVALAGEEMKAIKELYCSDDAAIREKVVSCLDALPDKVHQAKGICKEESAPGVTDDEEFRKMACDDSTGVAEKMHACMDRLKVEHAEKITKDDMEQIMTVVSCVTDLIAK